MPAHFTITRIGPDKLSEPIIGTVDRDLEFSFENYELEYDIAFEAMGGNKSEVLQMIEQMRGNKIGVYFSGVLNMYALQAISCHVMGKVANELGKAVEYEDIRRHTRTIQKVAKRMANYWMSGKFPKEIIPLQEKTVTQLATLWDTPKEAMPYRYVYYLECLSGLRYHAYTMVTRPADIGSYTDEQSRNVRGSLYAHEMLDDYLPIPLTKMRIAESVLLAYGQNSKNKMMIGFQKYLDKFESVMWERRKYIPPSSRDTSGLVRDEDAREIAAMVIDTIGQMQNDRLIGPFEVLRVPF